MGNRTRENIAILLILLGLGISSYVINVYQGKHANDSETGVSGEIVVGVVDSLTGPEASFGVETVNGVRMAFNELNVAGGIGGRPVRLVALDDQGKPEEAATAMTNLIEVHHAVAVIGEAASQRTLVIAPIAESHEVPLISPGATHPEVTKIGPHIFRVCFIDDFQGKYMADFAVNYLKAKRIAILTDVKSDYSAGLADWFTRKVEKLGGKIIKKQSYAAGDLDFKSQLTALRTHKPDAIFIPGYYTEVGLIMKQARELGIKANILGGDGWDSPRLVEIAGEASEKSYFSNHFAPEGNTEPLVNKFIETYKEDFRRLPGSSAALGYDAALVVIDAMKRSPRIDRAAITNALRQTKNITGVTGNITIGPDRNAIKAAVVVKISKGQFTHLAL